MSSLAIFILINTLLKNHFWKWIKNALPTSVQYFVFDFQYFINHFRRSFIWNRSEISWEIAEICMKKNEDASSEKICPHCAVAAGLAKGPKGCQMTKLSPAVQTASRILSFSFVHNTGCVCIQKIFYSTPILPSCVAREGSFIISSSF